jgi:hypothetical protein
LHSLLTSIAAGALDNDNDNDARNGSAPPSRASRDGSDHASLSSASASASSSSLSSSQQHRQQASARAAQSGRQQRQRHLPEALVWHIYAQVAAGLSYLHSMHIAHRCATCDYVSL